jgi:DNA-binding transcriptional regulator YiaG
MIGAEMISFVTGRHLRAARILARLSQADLARAAGVHRNCVKYWESDSRKGSPSGWAVDRLRDALAEHGVRAEIRKGERGDVAVIRQA